MFSEFYLTLSPKTNFLSLLAEQLQETCSCSARWRFYFTHNYWVYYIASCSARLACRTGCNVIEPIIVCEIEPSSYSHSQLPLNGETKLFTSYLSLYFNWYSTFCWMK